MIWIVDVILLIIFIATVVVSTVRGFVGTVFDLLRLAASIAITFFASPVVCRYFPLVSQALIYPVVFLAAYLLMILIGALLNKVFGLPGLRVVNRFLGFVLGIGSAYIILSFTVAFIGALPDVLGADKTLYTVSQLENGTVIYGFFSDHGILSVLGMLK